MKRLSTAVSTVVAMATMFLGVVTQSAPASAGTPATIPYTASITVSPPTPSSYAGAGGGDGWGLAFTQGNVYNVFHHDSNLEVECHVQSTAAQCTNNSWPVMISDNTNDLFAGDSFTTASQPTVWINQNTGYLYVYATAYGPSNGQTAGVVCVDTGSNAPDPFCGFTPLSSVGDSPVGPSSISNVSDAVIINNNFYAFNYVSEYAPTDSPADLTTTNTMMCFSLTTFSACPLQPFSVGLSAPLPVDDFPSPSIGAVGSKIIIPFGVDGTPPSFTCFDTTTMSNCTGNWPIVDPNLQSLTPNGAPLPVLDPTTDQAVGFCERTTLECWDTSANSIPTPQGMTSMPYINSGQDDWAGPVVQIGSRVYFNFYSGVDCYDYATSSECQNYPLQLQNYNLGYSVNLDPNRPGCIWVNSDEGSGQIQNFDAYSTGSCGSSGDRVSVSQFVAPGGTCNPTDYTSLKVISPAPSTYSGGTLQFEDSDGNPIGTTISLDSTGTASLVGLNFSTLTTIPQGLINLPGAPSVPVTVQLSWNGSPSTACDLVPSAPTPATASVTDNGNGTGTAVISWVAPTNNGGTPVTGYNVYAQPGGESCTATAVQTACTIMNLPNFTNYTFLVEAINAVGASQPATSNPAGVAAGAAVNDTPPTITGPTAVGSTLTATSGTWSIDTGTYSYQWYSCTDTPPSNPTADSNCSTVGSNQNTYVVQSSDLGNHMFVVVTATGTDTSTTTMWSNVEGPMIQTGPAVNTLLPTISGSTLVGSVLTATTGNWTSGTNTFTYQWKACSGSSCTTVGANSATFTTSEHQAGKTITVTVTDRGTDASTTPATSANFGPIVSNNVAQAALRITNATLSNSVGTKVMLTTSGGSGTGSVTFAATGSGCTVSHSVITSTQIGTCVVTATKAASTGFTAVSSSAVRFSFVAAPVTNLGSIHFVIGSSALTSSSMPALASIVNAALAKYATLIVVTGYASQSGLLSLNMQLSASRATTVVNAIRKILLAQHVTGVTVRGVTGGILTKYANEAQNIEAIVQA